MLEHVRKHLAALRNALTAALPDWLVTFLRTLKLAGRDWFAHDPFRNSAIISYYAIFSLPGLLLIVINFVGFFFGREIVVERIVEEVSTVIGQDTAASIQAIIQNTWRDEDKGLTTLFGAGILLFGATGVFYQIQQTLNRVWQVQPKARTGILKRIRDRLFSFGLVITIGFLMLISLLLSAALNIFSDWITAHFNLGVNILLNLLNMLLSFIIVTALFAAIYKFMPDAEIRLKDVLAGAAFTALLFLLSEAAVGYYFGRSDPGSTYGAAGSLVLIMLWVFYAGLILLFGAQFTRHYADQYGVEIKPAEFAEPSDEQS